MGSAWTPWISRPRPGSASPSCTRRARTRRRAPRAGDWSGKQLTGKTGNVELAGRTLGIVGVGNIGRRVAKFAGALGMRVLGYDKYVPDDEGRRRGAEPVAGPEGRP